MTPMRLACTGYYAYRHILYMDAPQQRSTDAPRRRVRVAEPDALGDDEQNGRGGVAEEEEEEGVGGEGQRAVAVEVDQREDHRAGAERQPTGHRVGPREERGEG